MSWDFIGWAAAVALGAAGTAISILFPNFRFLGYVFFAISAATILLTVYGMLQKLCNFAFGLVKQFGVLNSMLIFSAIGAIVFLSIFFGLLIFRDLKSPGQFSIFGYSDSKSGSIDWIRNFSMEGGVGGEKVFSLRFRGANISKEPVELKAAAITSLIDGSRINLDIVGVDEKGNSQIVALDSVELIPPGAPIELVAKFGPVNPDDQTKILGLDSKLFLEKWRKFSFNVSDGTDQYRFEYNENDLMPFFRGQVGPRVALKHR